MKKINNLFLLTFLFSFVYLAAESPKICLTMVVGNDESVIEKCLDSVKDLVDCVSICDIGSTDNTYEIIDRFLNTYEIPGKIYRHKWQNFGFNRTLSAQCAQKTLKEFGFPLSSSYLLVLDSDMNMQIGGGFAKSSLEADSYSLLLKSSALTYSNYNARLLRASLTWECVGTANEYWSTKNPQPTEKIKNWVLEDHGNAEYKKMKVVQSIDLLNEAIALEPMNSRYLFLLAQSLKSVGKYEEAIHYYTERLKIHGDEEEVWYSEYMIGECYEKSDEWEDALFWYLESFQTNPNRPEPLRKISTHYRLRSQNDLACIFAKYGSRIPYPMNANIWDYPPLGDYQFEEELSISAYYTQFRKDGFDAANEVILKKNVPWHIKDQTYRNILYYVDHLKNTRFDPIAIDFPLIQDGFSEKYHPMNPSILKTDSGYEVICRTVNYTQMGAKIFNTIDITGVFKTRNFLAEYNRDFDLLSQREIVENIPIERLPPCNVVGLEDCRLFGFQNSLWFTCTTFDTNLISGRPQITLCKLSDDPTEEFANVEKMVPLLGPDPYRCEKNWLPFVWKDELYTIYSYDPFTILKPDLETGSCITAHQVENEHDFSSFRGSAGPIEFDSGYLILVHEAVHHLDYSRAYLHRFIYLDENFMIKRITKPFTYLHQGIEFCNSMTLDHSGERLIMAVGIEDREAYLCTVDLDTIRSMLYEVN